MKLKVHKNTGKKRTEEFKRKRSEKYKGKNNPFYGKTHLDETKKKISEANKGTLSGDKNPSKRFEVKEKISNSHKGKKKDYYSPSRFKKGDCAGEKNPNWRGGIGKLPWGFEFTDKLKKQIRERDNYQCQECKYTEKQLGYRLSIHHIDYNKHNNNPNNLISLCKNCHGQTNFKREDWSKYFRQKE